MNVQFSDLRPYDSNLNMTSVGFEPCLTLRLIKKSICFVGVRASFEKYAITRKIITLTINPHNSGAKPRFGLMPTLIFFSKRRMNVIGRLGSA